jgi:hypothetical protein
MSSYFRLKQHLNNSWSTSQISDDIRTLLEENEKYKQAYTSLKSCQVIAEVEEVDLLAKKIKQLLKESKILEKILTAKNKAEIYKHLKDVKIKRESEKN